jgi:NAD+ diphosphatase
MTDTENRESMSASGGPENPLVFIVKDNNVLAKSGSAGTAFLCAKDFKTDITKFERAEYLGLCGDVPCYCLSFGDDIAIPERAEFRNLWELLFHVDEKLMNTVFKAVHIVHWLKNSRFCGACGNPTVNSDIERARICKSCGNTIYPRISPAVILAITWKNRLLLAHNKSFTKGSYSLIAGFIEPGETFEDAAKREAYEETGIRIKNIKYFGSQPWPFPDSLMIGLTAEYDEGEITPDGTEIDKAEWFKASELPNFPGTFSIAGRLIEWFAQNAGA